MGYDVPAQTKEQFILPLKKYKKKNYVMYFQQIWKKKIFWTRRIIFSSGYHSFIKKHHKKDLSENIESNFVCAGTTLSSKSQIKDRTKEKHRHDLVYHVQKAVRSV